MKAEWEQAALFYDTPNEVVEGDYLRTGTGRLYLITEVRVQQAGKHAGRYHLKTTVMPSDRVIEPDAAVHTVNWYPRSHTRRSST